jgi:hypothetical protein
MGRPLQIIDSGTPIHVQSTTANNFPHFLLIGKVNLQRAPYETK